MASDAPSDRTRITVGIIDDFAILLESLRLWLERNAPDIEVAVCASTFKEFVNDPSFPPRVVLIGELRNETASMGARIRACVAAGSQVVVVADNAAVSHRVAMEAGAAEALSRKTPMLEIVDAIRRADARSQQNATVSRESLVRPNLSPSENQALALYVQGASTQEVATAMNVKYETAKTFLRRVRQKYARVERPAGKRSDLMVRATEDGII